MSKQERIKTSRLMDDFLKMPEPEIFENIPDEWKISDNLKKIRLKCLQIERYDLLVNICEKFYVGEEIIQNAKWMLSYFFHKPMPKEIVDFIVKHLKYYMDDEIDNKIKNFAVIKQIKWFLIWHYIHYPRKILPINVSKLNCEILKKHSKNNVIMNLILSHIIKNKMNHLAERIKYYIKYINFSEIVWFLQFLPLPSHWLFFMHKKELSNINTLVRAYKTYFKMFGDGDFGSYLSNIVSVNNWLKHIPQFYVLLSKEYQSENKFDLVKCYYYGFEICLTPKLLTQIKIPKDSLKTLAKMNSGFCKKRPETDLKLYQMLIDYCEIPNLEWFKTTENSKKNIEYFLNLYLKCVEKNMRYFPNLPILPDDLKLNIESLIVNKTPQQIRNYLNELNDDIFE